MRDEGLTPSKTGVQKEKQTAHKKLKCYKRKIAS
jgi:hypothetical protein